MDNDEIVISLIDILFDSEADPYDLSDAVMQLGNYDNEKALKALVQAAQDPKIDDWCVLQSCGDSIAEIWLRKKYFNKKIFNSLCKSARVGAYYTIFNLKPEWIEKYDIKIDPD